MNKFIWILLLGLVWPQALWAAIGCTLGNPAEDLKYLFPDMTSYKEELKEFTRMKDGRALFQTLKERLGRDLDPLYETYETPYTVYSVYRGKQRVGLVHGVNVPGRGGVIQVFLSVDPATGAIQRFFFQRLESPAARALRDKGFRAQWTGLTLGDLYKHDYYLSADPGSPQDKVGKISLPKAGAEGKADVEASVRGVRKNLILLDLFVFGGRFEPFYEKAHSALSGQGKGEKP